VFYYHTVSWLVTIGPRTWMGGGWNWLRILSSCGFSVETSCSGSRDLRDRGWESLDWIHLAQDRTQWRDFVNEGMNLRVP